MTQKLKKTFNFLSVGLIAFYMFINQFMWPLLLETQSFFVVGYRSFYYVNVLYIY